MCTGFIGLGTLGKAVAQRLIEKGEKLLVWNRTKSKADGLDVELADSPCEVISNCDRTFLNLFDSNAVHSIMIGEKGLLAGAKSGKIVIDLTTNHYDTVVAFHEMFEECGVCYLEAPVIGSVMPALQGQLTSIVSGDKKVYESCQFLFEKYCAHFFYFKEPGTASKIKVLNNLVLGTFMASLAESVAFAEEAGVDKESFIEILSVGAGNSAVLNAKRDKLIKEDFSNHFSNACILKDINYLQELANDLKFPLFIGSVVKELYTSTFNNKIDQLDFSSIYQVFKDKI